MLAKRNMKNIFKNLMILGRPASGKSEFIDFMKETSDEDRERKFRIGEFIEVDDFVWVWEKIEEDDCWEKIGGKRLYSAHYMAGNPGVTPKGKRLLDFCIQRFNREIGKKYLGNENFYRDHTLFIEFARGRDGGFEKALNNFNPEILKDAAILFIYVTREESWRRNTARYQEELKHSVLTHMVPKETFDYFYSDSDWLDLTHNESNGYLSFNGVKVPFVTMNNEPESTESAVLEQRYDTALDKLWELYKR